MKKGNLKFWQVAEVKLSYRHTVQAADRPQVRSSREAADVLRANWSDDMELQESFNLLLLNRANRVIGLYTVSKGGLTGTVVDAKLVYAAAVKALACSIILAHNHPSGNLRPSQADIDLTHKLTEAGKVLDIAVIDHIILGQDSYYSFADEGRL